MLRTLLTLLPVLALAACDSNAPEPAKDPHQAPTTDRLEPYTCGSIGQMHTLDGVFLAGQPSADDFGQAQLAGMRTVINLRKPAEPIGFDEEAVVSGLGMTYVGLAWNGADELTDEVFDRGRELLRDAERPILVHCGSANRVGALWLPYRVLDGGLTWEEALAEARTVGLKTSAYVDRARAYLDGR